MSTHHPRDELLLDYAAGTLGEGWSIAIASHLALCPRCRSRIAAIEGVGGAFLEAAEPVPVAASAFDAISARIAAVEPDPKPSGDVPPPRSDPDTPHLLPKPLRDYLQDGVSAGHADDLSWRPLGLGAYQIRLETGDPDGGQVRLLRIPAGKPVPDHGHRGLELTLVLAGAFSDATGTYRRGDLQTADDALSHQPHAAPGEDCICLAVTEAPLRFRSLAMRFMQPLIGI